MIPRQQPEGLDGPPAPMSKKRLVLLVVMLVGSLIVLKGLSNVRHAAEPGVPNQGTLVVAAQMMVRQHLRDPASATFSDIVVHSGRGGRSSVVCGRVNARNGFGGMAGLERFVVGDTTTLESEVGADMMTQLWARTC